MLNKSSEVEEEVS